MILSSNKSQAGKDALNLVNTSSDNWQKVKLMDVCSLRSEIIDPEKASNCRYVGLEHIDTGKPFLARWGTASDVKSSKFRFYSNDILYGKLRPYLEKSVKVDFEGICSTDILVFCPNSSVDADFLSYLIHTHGFTNHAIQSTVGVNHPRTSWSSLADFDILLPPLPEQRAIAHILQTVQQAIQTRRKELELERERKAALMQHLFTHGTRNEPTKQSEVGEIPESWQVRKLGEVLQNAQYGISLAGKSAGMYPILRMNNLVDGAVTHDNLQYVDIDEKTFALFRLKRGDILFNRTNSADLVGKTALFDEDSPAVFASYLIRIITDKEMLLPGFLNCYFNWEVIQKRLQSIATRGVSQANISASNLQNFRLPIPPLLAEQAEIAQIFNFHAAKVAALSKEITLHEELFRALLDELMTGRMSTLPLVGELEKGTLTDG